MGWELHDPASYIFYGLAVGMGIGVFAFVDRFETWTCKDPYDRAVNEPEVNPSESRLGRAARPPLDREFVLYKAPNRSEERCARVVALGGQTIEITAKGEVLLDDKKPEEEAKARLLPDCDVPKVLVPRDCFFVLCEQRTRPGAAYHDSRGIGPVELWSVNNVFTFKNRAVGVRTKEQ